MCARLSFTRRSRHDKPYAGRTAAKVGPQVLVEYGSGLRRGKEGLWLEPLITILAVELMEDGQLPSGRYSKDRSAPDAALATPWATIHGRSVESTVSTLNKPGFRKGPDRQAEANYEVFRWRRVDCVRGSRKG
jgi:hypothetical protein